MSVFSYVTANFNKKKLSFSGINNAIKDFEKKNFTNQLVKNGACIGIVLVLLKLYEEYSNKDSNNFYVTINNLFKENKKIMHDIYFIMQMQNYIADSLNESNDIGDKILYFNQYIIAKNKDKSTKLSYYLTQYYINAVKLNWVFIKFSQQLNSMPELYSEINNNFLTYKEVYNNISLCFSISILFKDFCFLSQKHIRAHKISIIINIKNQQTTLLFIDPNEGLFEFPLGYSSDLRMFKSFFYSAIRLNYSIQSCNFELLLKDNAVVSNNNSYPFLDCEKRMEDLQLMTKKFERTKTFPVRPTSLA